MLKVSGFYQIISSASERRTPQQKTYRTVQNLNEALENSNIRFLQEPHGVTTQKTPFFIVTAMKTSNLTYLKHAIKYGRQDTYTS
jgi:hypothetical protein